MIKRIIHIADLHIPNESKNRPFDVMLKSFLKQVRKDTKELNPEDVRILLVGDIFDNKIKATNEAREMFHNTLNYLNQMGVTLIVAGNHDMLQNNRDRMDSINPTFGIDGAYRNVSYLDRELCFKSGCIADDGIIWALYSMHDDFARPDIESLRNDNPGSMVIGLYHGDVAGAVTDLGRTSENGIDTDLFEGCDIVMAGHIHRHQVIRRNGIPIVYAGSVFQKDAGENTTGHGYVVWDMPEMNPVLREVDNDYRVFRFKAMSYEDIKNDTEELLNL